MKQSDFLSRDKNKIMLIRILQQKLIDKAHIVHIARADADKLIVDTAISLSSSSTTVVVGQDRFVRAFAVFTVSVIKDQSDIFLIRFNQSKVQFFPETVKTASARTELISTSSTVLNATRAGNDVLKRGVSKHTPVPYESNPDMCNKYKWGKSSFEKV